MALALLCKGEGVWPAREGETFVEKGPVLQEKALVAKEEGPCCKRRRDLCRKGARLAREGKGAFQRRRRFAKEEGPGCGKGPDRALARLFKGEGAYQRRRDRCRKGAGPGFSPAFQRRKGPACKRRRRGLALQYKERLCKGKG